MYFSLCPSYLGEVEHDIDKNKRDAKHKDPEDQVKSEEPEGDKMSD